MHYFDAQLANCCENNSVFLSVEKYLNQRRDRRGFALHHLLHGALIHEQRGERINMSSVVGHTGAPAFIGLLLSLSENIHDWLDDNGDCFILNELNGRLWLGGAASLYYDEQANLSLGGGTALLGVRQN